MIGNRKCKWICFDFLYFSFVGTVQFAVPFTCARPDRILIYVRYVSFASFQSGNGKKKKAEKKPDAKPDHIVFVFTFESHTLGLGSRCNWQC